MTYLENPKNWFCAACGKEVEKITTVCSSFGGYSFGLCDKCVTEMREPYNLMVADIAMVTVGDFPNGVNEVFQKEVMRQLELHGKTVEEFNKDIKEMLEIFDESQIPSGEEDKYDDFEVDWF
jgi:hypothetical protein